MPLIWVFFWIAGVFQPALVLTMLSAGFSLDESLTASGAMAVVAVEIAIRLRDSDDGDDSGMPMLGRPVIA